MNITSADISVFTSHLIATDSGFHRYSYDDPSATLRTGHRNLAQQITTDTGIHRYIYDHEGRRIGKQYNLS